MRKEVTGGYWDFREQDKLSDGDWAASHRGWLHSTSQPIGTVAFYLDYGPGHLRYDEGQETEPGHVYVCVYSSPQKEGGTGCSLGGRFCETVAEAQAWAYAQAVSHGLIEGR